MHKKIFVPIYGVRIDLFSSPESCNTFFGEEVFTDDHEALAGDTFSGDANVGVYMAFRKNCAQDITHECVHAAWRVLHKCGIQVSRTNHEALAYVAGWLAEQVTAFLKKAEKV